MTGRRSTAGVSLVLAALLASPSGRTSGASTAVHSSAGFLTLVLGPDGSVNAWKAGDASLSPLPASLSRLVGHPANDLAFAGDGGKVVVLPAAAPRPGGRHNRLAGSAVVISSPTTAAPPAILDEIPFEGDGRRVVVSRDGRHAYVLALPALPDPVSGELRARLLALDLDEGRVVATARLDRPPSALALDPDDTRIFLSYTGKIQTYTTRPLAQSWFYRSPGPNRGMGFRPGSAVLYLTRLDQMALFDPRIIARRNPEERQKLLDDATGVFRLPIAADSLLFSRDGGLLAAFGAGNGVAFVEPSTGSVTTAPLGQEGAKSLRPFYFDGVARDLIVASYPGKEILTVEAPATTREAGSAEPQATSPLSQKISPETSSPAGAQTRQETAPVQASPSPPPESPAARPAASPTVPEPTPTPAPVMTPELPPPVIPEAPASPHQQATLSGHLTGEVGFVESIVVYRPGSIVREQARVAPGAEGVWRVPLPPRGAYRIVPLGKGARPLRAEPNFRTLDVQDQGVTGLDFRILGTN